MIKKQIRQTVVRQPKLVQILQIPSNQRITAVYRDPDGSEFHEPCTLIALDSDGDIKVVTIDSDGIFDDPQMAENFLRFDVEYS